MTLNFFSEMALNGCRGLRLRASWIAAVPALAAFLLATGMLSGCLSRPSLVGQSFSFSIAPPSPRQPQNRGGILEIRQIAVAPPFDSQSFTYRTGPNSYERDHYAQFLVPPAEDLMTPLRGYLRSSGRFREVTEPGSDLAANTLASVNVVELYGDFRNRSHSLAVLRMNFIFYTPGPRGAPKILLQKTYDQHVPFKPNTAAALMSAWDDALKRIMAELNSDLSRVKLSE